MSPAFSDMAVIHHVPCTAQSQMCPYSEQGKCNHLGAAQLFEGICPSQLERGARQPLLLASTQPFLPAASQQICSSLCSHCPASCLPAPINPLAAWETMINFLGERGLLIYLIRRSDGPNEVWGENRVYSASSGGLEYV